MVQSIAFPVSATTAVLPTRPCGVATLKAITFAMPVGYTIKLMVHLGKETKRRR